MSGPLRFALIGKTIAYSKSPAIFDAIFDELGIAGSFDVVDVSDHELAATVEDFRHSDLGGFSVTIPYKSQVIPLLDEINHTVEVLEAVNCVQIDSEGRLSGHNTDCYGFALPMLELGASVAGGRAVIIGYGGAARAIAFSLASAFRIGDFVIVGRNREQRELFASWLRNVAPEAAVAGRPLEEIGLAVDRDVAMVVNCTPMGGYNLPDLSPVGHSFDWSRVGVYYDLNYNASNKTVARAREAVEHVFDGSTMLVGQAIRAFEIWSGKSVTLDPIYARVFQ
ncbi:shikimate dehydrogenase [bacterium]|nr:shikimate dehydrogenase [bacterium]MCB2201988.1 shikimate dehydrogenase [bacterium]